MHRSPSLARSGGLLWLLVAGMCTALAGDLPPDVLLLSRFRQRVRQDINRLANCTCLETMERAVREPGAGSFQFLDRVRLEVTHAGKNELLAWPGGARFEQRDAAAFVGGGLVASGLFVSLAGNLFVEDQATFQYRGSADLDGRRTVRYDFRIPLLSSTYMLRVGNNEEVVASKGAFWFDADSLALIRLEQVADEIPAGLGITGSLIRVSYEPAGVAGEEVLLPQTMEIVLTHSSGEVRRNTVQFAQCRVFSAESSIAYNTPPPAAVARRAEQPPVDLPAGLTIHLQLEGNLDSAATAIGDPVRALVAEDVRRNGQVILPKGALVSGRVRGMYWRKRDGGCLLSIEFAEMLWDQHRAEFHARLLQAQTGTPVKAMRGMPVSASNIVGLDGSGLPSDMPTLELSGTRPAAGSASPGVCTLLMKDERWRVSGLRMAWRTVAP